MLKNVNFNSLMSIQACIYRCVAKSAANQPTVAPRLTIAIGYVAPGPNSGLAWSYRRNKASTGSATHAVKGPKANSSQHPTTSTKIQAAI